LDFISAPFPRQRFYTLLTGPNFGEHFTPPAVHARSSFPASPGIVSVALVGAEEDAAVPPTRPPLDAQSFALNSPVPDTAGRAVLHPPAPSTAPPVRSRSPSC